MKVVLDTNILIAAFATRGLCNAILEVCVSAHEILLSEYILQETEKAFSRKLKLPRPLLDENIAYLRYHAILGVADRITVQECRDPKDWPVLGLALSMQADCLVTGDGDLLTLKVFQRIPILNPREFWNLARKT